MSHIIYTLIDPRDLKIRYVGQTMNVEDRMHHHTSFQKGRSYRDNWLNKLRSLNLKPIMQVIEKCYDTNWQERERYWIKYYRDLGYDLVNATEGGEGTQGYKHREESIEKMRLAKTGKNHPMFGTKRMFTSVHKENIAKALAAHSINRETGQRVVIIERVKPDINIDAIASVLDFDV